MSGPGEGSENDGLKGLAAVLGRPAPTRRQLLLGGGHLLALWALTFVQPLLDLLGDNPDFFVARGNTPGDILILAIGFTFLPPLVLLLFEWVASKVSTKVYYGLHFVFLGFIATFFFIRFVSDLIAPRTSILILLSLVLAALLAWSVFRFVFVRNLMDILIVAPVVILLLFVFASNTSEVIFPEQSEFELAADSGSDNPIVMVIYDELGTSNLMTDDRRIDAARYPNFARLSRTATWYKNQSTTAFFTPLALPGILTGIRQPPETLPTAEAQPLSLFSQFGRNRPMHVMEPVTAICPQDLCPEEKLDQGRSARLKDLYSDLKYVEGRLVLPPGLANKLPDVSSNFEGFGGEAEPEVASPVGSRPRDAFLVKGLPGSDPANYEQFIQQIPDSDRGLTVMHFHLPHKPWKYNTKGRQYNNSPINNLSQATNSWLVDSNGIASAQSRMYAQTGFSDYLLGKLREKLEAEGLWDKAIVIVAADHGGSFEGGDVPQRRLDERTIGEVANPPLLIKYPGQKQGETSLKHSMTLDIVPTIAQALGVKDPYETDGVPLQGPVPNREVSIDDFKGNVVTSTLPEMVRQRNAAIARANDRLGTGPFYTLGPAPQLVGRKVEPVPPGTAEAAIDDSALDQDYDPATDLIPMFVTGTWNGTLPADPEEAPVLAIAVNGTVQATARPFEFNEALRWGGLVNPASLRPGENQIGIYRLEGDQLIPLGGN